MKKLIIKSILPPKYFDSKNDNATWILTPIRKICLPILIGLFPWSACLAQSADITTTQHIKIEETTSSPALNAIYGNSVSIAFGSVALGFSDIQTGYGITSFTNPAVGQYDVVIDHATNSINPIVIITPYTGAFGAPEIAGYQPTGTNSFTIRIQTAAGTATNSAFSFVVYGNH